VTGGLNVYAPGDRVAWAGQVGVVLSMDGGYAQVSLPAGVRSVPLDELAKHEDEPTSLLLADRLGPSTAYQLRLRAEFLRHAYRFDPLAGLSNARVEPKHHQVYVAHRVTRKASPRMVLADEVGLGKTIEAGLILKELRAREAAGRTLIVTPANLATQWQQEMRVKFNEDFVILDRNAAQHFGRDGTNPFEASDSIIVSLAFASREARIEQISELPWDLVIFDEAHRVRLGRQSRTRAYELAERLRDNVPGLLLLTATPMQLGVTELWGLIDLVEPGLYPTVGYYQQVSRQLPMLNALMREIRNWPTLTEAEQGRVLEQHGQRLSGAGVTLAHIDGLDTASGREEVLDLVASRHPLSEVLVRNRRVDVGGFTARRATRIMVEMSADEEEAQEAVTEYLRQTYNLAGGGNNALGFLLVTYHKMLASSPAAIYTSLRRRREALQAKLELELTDEEGTLSSADRRERRDVLELEDAAEGLDGVRSTAVALETEIIELTDIIERLGKLRDSKAHQLVQLVDRILESDPDEKVLIFTQFVETQRLLRAALEHRRYRVEIFNGRQSIAEKDQSIERFRRQSQVLISTEAGGEGRNLQFCHIMFNYDLPWNPMRVEQRIGRIDRIGQQRAVSIYNLANVGTVEERVLEVLEHRIRIFEESVGSLDPILGNVERDIENLVMLGDEAREEAFAKLEVDLERRVKEAITTQETLHDFAMERNSFRRDETNLLLQQRGLASAEDLERFVADALDYEGGTLAEEVDGRTSITLSQPLSQRLRIRTQTHRGTFEPAIAVREEAWDFFAMGHPLVDGLLNLAYDDVASRAGTRITDDAPSPLGVEVIYELEVDGGQHSGRMVRHVIGEDLQVRSEHVTQPFVPSGEPRTVEPPGWGAEAVNLSRRTAQLELDALRQGVRDTFEELRAERLVRAARLAEHRKRQNRLLEARLDNQIEGLEVDDDASRRRILPALRARREKARARIAEIEAELEAELARIQSDEPRASLRVVAAGLIAPP
jgi:superfamily II DNA or RNA helicase